MKLTFSALAIDKAPAELVVLLAFQESLPFQGLLGLLDWRINGKLSRLAQDQFFSGKAGECLLMPCENRFKAKKVLLIGLGKREAFEEGHIPQVFDYLIETTNRMKVEQMALSLSRLIPIPFEWRNSLRLFSSRLSNVETSLKEVIFCEPTELVQEAKRRQLDLGPNFFINFDI